VEFYCAINSQGTAGVVYLPASACFLFFFKVHGGYSKVLLRSRLSAITVYVCMHVCVCMCECVCMCACMCVFACLCVCVCVCVHVCVCLRACVRACVCKMLNICVSGHV